MSLPYFPMYPTDFEADTSHLTLAEDGAYNRLLRLMWMTPGCSLPDDDAWVMRRMRCTTAEDVAIVTGIIAEYFQRKAGRIISPRLAKEYQKTDLAHRKRVDAGSRGGKAKALQSKGKASSNAKAMLYQPEPEPEPYKEEEPKGSLSADTDAKPFDEIAEAVAAYNSAAEQSGWPKVAILSKSRRSALTARLKEAGGLDGWNAALDKAKTSNHCCGQNERGWTASFDFIARQSSFAKLMEGNYDNRIGNNQSPGHRGGVGGISKATEIADRAARIVANRTSNC